MKRKLSVLFLCLLFLFAVLPLAGCQKSAPETEIGIEPNIPTVNELQPETLPRISDDTRVVIADDIIAALGADNGENFWILSAGWNQILYCVRPAEWIELRLLNTVSMKFEVLSHLDESNVGNAFFRTFYGQVSENGVLFAESHELHADCDRPESPLEDRVYLYRNGKTTLVLNSLDYPGVDNIAIVNGVYGQDGFLLRAGERFKQSENRTTYSSYSYYAVDAAGQVKRLTGGENWHYFSRDLRSWAYISYTRPDPSVVWVVDGVSKPPMPLKNGYGYIVSSPYIFGDKILCVSVAEDDHQYTMFHANGEANVTKTHWIHAAVQANNDTLAALSWSDLIFYSINPESDTIESIDVSHLVGPNDFPFTIPYGADGFLIYSQSARTALICTP